jgi:hypothetical protein
MCQFQTRNNKKLKIKGRLTVAYRAAVPIGVATLYGSVLKGQEHKQGNCRHSSVVGSVLETLGGNIVEREREQVCGCGVGK